jgi:hypothetical protein
MPTTDLATERRDREVRWLTIEIARLQRLGRIGALVPSEVDRRVSQYQDRLKALSTENKHHAE